MSSVSIFIFRHGETDWNVEKRFQGHTDIPLNAKGRQQALGLAKILEPLQLETILSSDLSRALETAQIASASLNIPVVKTPDLRESLLGEPEGKLRDEIIKIYGEEKWKKWLSVKPEDLDFAFPKGETKRAQLQRVQNFVLKFFEENRLVRNIGLSTHGGTLRRLLHACEGAPTQPIPIPNCSVYHLEFRRPTEQWIFKRVVSTGAPSGRLFT